MLACIFRCLTALVFAISEDRYYTPKFDTLRTCCIFSSPPSTQRYTEAHVPMVKSVDTADLKSAATKVACRFDPGSGHQTHGRMTGATAASSPTSCPPSHAPHLHAPCRHGKQAQRHAQKH